MLRAVGLLALVAAGVAIGVWASIEATRGSGRIATVWPVNAAVLILLLRSSPRLRAGLILAAAAGNFAANVYAGDAALRALLFTAANSVEIATALILTARPPALRLWKPAHVARLLRAATIACLASTAVAAVALTATGHQPGLADLTLWFMADWLGLVIFVPLGRTLCDARARIELLSRPRRGRLLSLAAVAGLSAPTFLQTQFPLLFVPVAVITVLAFTLGLAGTAVACLVVTVIAIPATLAGYGPLALLQPDPALRVLVLQAYLGSLAVTGLTVAAQMSSQKVLARHLKGARARAADRARARDVLIKQGRLAEGLSQVGYWTLDLRSRQIFWSPEVYRIHGVTPDAFDPNLSDALDFFLPEDRERISALIQERLSHASGWSFEARLRRADGELRDVVSRAQCEVGSDGRPLSLFGVFQDLTDDRRLRASLEERERTYRLLAENVTDVIATYDTDSRFTYLSPSIETLLGHKVEDLIGRSTFDIIDPRDHDALRAQFRAAMQAGADGLTVEYRALDASGEVRWLEAKPRFHRDDTGRVLHITDSVRDVGERKAREEALAAARQEAEEAGRAKVAFLATMSHEIRTPLNGVLGFADLLHDTPLDEAQSRYVDRISAAGRGLSALIDDILDLSRLEAGDMPLDQAPIDLNALCEETTALVSAARADGEVRFSVSLADDAPRFVSYDPKRLRQILINLLGNASKFTHSGSVVLSVSCDRRSLVFRVIDTGCGIPADRLAGLFQPFTQADASVARKFGGSGLGLSISRALARKMGGDIQLSSVEGEGTIASLTLPLRATVAPAAHTRRSAPVTRQARILVVDDFDMNRELIEELLRRRGHQVVAAASGPEAIRMLQAEGGEIDLVLMDVQMPEMDGLEATRIIRSLREIPAGLPIVALTAHAMVEQVEACRQAGMDDHLAKPIDSDRLQSVIEKMLQRRDQTAAPPPTDDGARDLLRRYVDHLGGTPGQIDALLAEPFPDALPRLAALAHTLAGSSGMFGFPTLSEPAFDLEACARSTTTTQTAVIESADVLKAVIARELAAHRATSQ